MFFVLLCHHGFSQKYYLLESSADTTGVFAGDGNEVYVMKPEATQKFWLESQIVFNGADYKVIRHRGKPQALRYGEKCLASFMHDSLIVNGKLHRFESHGRVSWSYWYEDREVMRGAYLHERTGPCIWIFFAKDVPSEDRKVLTLLALERSAQLTRAMPVNKNFASIRFMHHVRKVASIYLTK